MIIWFLVLAAQIVLVANLVLLNDLVVRRASGAVGNPTQAPVRLGYPRASGPSPALGPYGALILQASRRYHVDPYLIRAVMVAESAEKPKAVSRKNARGLMQLLPTTAVQLGARRTEDLFIPRTNIFLGTKYLAGLLAEFDGDLRKALIAYNAGPRVVQEGRPLPPETRAYVPRVLALWRSLRAGERAAT